MSKTTDFILNNPGKNFDGSEAFLPSDGLISLEVPARVNKTVIKGLANNIIDKAIDEGRVLKVAEGLSVMEKLVKAIREEDRFVDAVVDEVTINNRLVTTPNGTLIEVTEVAVKYDYSYDEEWRIIQEQIEQLTLQRKEREAVLRTAKDGKEKIDESTGEVIYGATKRSKTSYKVTLSK